MKPIDLSDQYDFVENSFLKNGDFTDKRAVNVNTIDHVPNSSWFTQRLGTAEVLSVQDVIRGPYRGQSPQPGIWTIVRPRAKASRPA